MQHPSSDAGRRSLARRAAPGVRLACALALVVGVALLPRRPDLRYLVPAAVLGVLWLACGLPLLYALRRMLVAQLFIVSIAGLSLVARDAAPVFLGTFLKSNLCIFTLVLLTWTTPFLELLQLLRRLRFPSVMLTTLALMYRYLPVLSEEAKRMERARASRTFSRRRRLAWQSLTTIIGQLFVRSADRAERIYLAMCARGWK